MESHRITNGELAVSISALGAEMTSILHSRAGELLWGAGPVWPQHAPNLFPIVGQLAGDQLHVDGRSYPLKRHGFARNRQFEFVERGAAKCRLVLRDDEQTRAVFPFAFELEIGYEVSAGVLRIAFTVRNSGGRTLPASVGAHPAFRWPLPGGAAKDAHAIDFERLEPAPIRRLLDGLLELERFASPIDGRTLPLNERLFDADAIILDELASRRVRYSAPHSPGIAVGWEGFRELGIWSKAGGDFLCIEPWRGYASPLDFDGPFEQKPGLMLIAPAQEQRLTIAIEVEG